MIKEEASKQEAALVDNAAAGKAADADAALAGARRRPRLLRLPDDDRHGLGRGPRRGARKSQRVKEVIQSRGFTVKDETLNSTQAWLGSLPGHVYANVRRPIVNSMNLTHLMPLSQRVGGRRGQPAPRERVRGRRAAPLLQHDRVDALSPAPRRRRRRPHAHHRADGQRQVDAARHAGARLAQVPGRPGHRLRQGPERARRDAGRRRDLLSSRARRRRRWPFSRSPTSTSRQSASGRRSSWRRCSRRRASRSTTGRRPASTRRSRASRPRRASSGR